MNDRFNKLARIANSVLDEIMDNPHVASFQPLTRPSVHALGICDIFSKRFAEETGCEIAHNPTGEGQNREHCYPLVDGSIIVDATYLQFCQDARSALLLRGSLHLPAPLVLVATIGQETEDILKSARIGASRYELWRPTESDRWNPEEGPFVKER